jgi:hypothetical protein
MPFQGFEGPAGTGKTHQLIAAASTHCHNQPLAAHHRILALTFMHGSRRRLDERLASPGPLRGLHSCMTIDSFALDIVRRWRTLAATLGIEGGDFNQTCDAAGRLLEHAEVAKWVAATYPVILVDEAQELSPPRLRIIRALADHAALYVAADEFQCLDENIDTTLFMEWFRTGRITPLTQIRRTSHQGLLDAALALRHGRTMPTRGRGLNIAYQHPNQMPFAIGHALHNARRAGGSIAMIGAPGTGNWIDHLLPRLQQGMQTSKQTVPPLTIERETRADTDITRIMETFGVGALPTAEVVRLLKLVPDPPPWLPQVIAAISHQERACAIGEWVADDLRAMIERKANLHRAYGYQHHRGIPVITIQSAKNRQFRHVVVLWGPGVPGDAQRKARLLYNAITRAEAQCTVFVQVERLLSGPPFQGSD